MTKSYKLDKALEDQVLSVDNVLIRYTDDEVGANQKQKYIDMTMEDKISLLTNTLISCSSWEDFETDLVINFDYGNY